MYVFAWETNRGTVMLVELAEVARALQDVRAPGSNIRTRAVQLQATLRPPLRQDIIPVSQRGTTTWSTRQKNAGSVLGVRHLSLAPRNLPHGPISTILPPFRSTDSCKASNFCEHDARQLLRQITDFGLRSTIFYLHTIVTATEEKTSILR